MFDQVNGLPVHVLVLHAAVVFVPLLALGAVVYALVSRWRPRIGWAVALLSIIAPLCTLVAKLSGEKLYDRLVANGTKGPTLDLLNEHMGYGSRTFLFSLALGVVTLILVLLTWRGPSKLPAIAQIGFAVVMVVLAGFTSYYIYKTGDTGAHAVWGQS